MRRICAKPMYFAMKVLPLISLEAGEHIPKEGMNVYLDNNMQNNCE